MTEQEIKKLGSKISLIYGLLTFVAFSLIFILVWFVVFVFCKVCAAAILPLIYNPIVDLAIVGLFIFLLYKVGERAAKDVLIRKIPRFKAGFYYSLRINLILMIATLLLTVLNFLILGTIEIDFGLPVFLMYGLVLVLFYGLGTLGIGLTLGQLITWKIAKTAGSRGYKV